MLCVHMCSGFAASFDVGVSDISSDTDAMPLVNSDTPANSAMESTTSGGEDLVLRQTTLAQPMLAHLCTPAADIAEDAVVDEVEAPAHDTADTVTLGVRARRLRCNHPALLTYHCIGITRCHTHTHTRTPVGDSLPSSPTHSSIYSPTHPLTHSPLFLARRAQVPAVAGCAESAKCQKR